MRSKRVHCSSRRDAGKSQPCTSQCLGGSHTSHGEAFLGSHFTHKEVSSETLQVLIDLGLCPHICKMETIKNVCLTMLLWELTEITHGSAEHQLLFCSM